MGLRGVEPLTSRLSGVRSNQLSYRPQFRNSTEIYPRRARGSIGRWPGDMPCRSERTARFVASPVYSIQRKGIAVHCWVKRTERHQRFHRARLPARWCRASPTQHGRRRYRRAASSVKRVFLSETVQVWRFRTSYVEHSFRHGLCRTVATPHPRIAMSLRLALPTLTLLYAMTNPPELPAQSVPLAHRPACSPTASVVSMLVRDAAGHPIPGTTVGMTRLRDGKSLGRATEMRAGSGEFALLESDALQWIALKGDRIRVRARAGRRTASGVIVVGRDASGCRIVRQSGPEVLTLK